MLAEIFQSMNEVLKTALAAALPAETWWGAFLINNGLVILSALALLIIIIVLCVSFFFDFISDAWKIPIAIGVDVLKYLGMFNPLLAWASVVTGILVFVILSDAHWVKWVFAAISAGAALAALFLTGSFWGVIIAVAPINAVMMAVAAVID